MTVHIMHGQQFQMSQDTEDHILRTYKVKIDRESPLQAQFSWGHPDSGKNYAIVSKPSEAYDRWKEAARKKH